MRLTKNNMARVVVAALYNMPALPEANHFQVVRLVRRQSADELRHQHKLAMKAIESRRMEPGESIEDAMK
jgi:hypothetical protein